MPDLVIAGAGMAGLVAAARARELGADVVLYEKGHRPGGAMLLSSGMIWRYRTFTRFRKECPAGDPVLQRLVYDRLDIALAWLERLGAAVLARETGNPLTSGMRFDPRPLTAALAGRAGKLQLGRPLREIPDNAPVVLATGGFQANRELVRAHITREACSIVLRSTPWSTGDGLKIALEAGATTSVGLNEFYGRALPAPPARIAEQDFVSLSQVYAHHADVESLTSERYRPKTWSEIDVVQWLAQQPGARARFRVEHSALARPATGGRTVGDAIDAAARAGAQVVRTPASITIDVIAGITSTLGGLAVDETAKAAPGVYAAGGDVGGLAAGGYASGLAAALVMGKVAAESALA
jgi:fumarate reductase flavoprotein subunit